MVLATYSGLSCFAFAAWNADHTGPQSVPLLGVLHALGRDSMVSWLCPPYRPKMPAMPEQKCQANQPPSHPVTFTVPTQSFPTSCPLFHGQHEGGLKGFLVSTAVHCTLYTVHCALCTAAVLAGNGPFCGLKSRPGHRLLDAL